MKRIIDISEEDYKECKFRKDLLSLGGEPTDLTFNMRMETTIANGTPLPQGHGNLIDAKDAIETLQIMFAGDEDIQNACEQCILDCPIIIEADKEKSGP